MCFGVKILNLVFFGVETSGISVFLVSAENGSGVNKMTNITYELLVCLAIFTFLKPSLLTNCRDFRLIPENLRSLACGSRGYKGDMFAC